MSQWAAVCFTGDSGEIPVIVGPYRLRRRAEEVAESLNRKHQMEVGEDGGTYDWSAWRLLTPAQARAYIEEHYPAEEEES